MKIICKIVAIGILLTMLMLPGAVWSCLLQRYGNSPQRSEDDSSEKVEHAPLVKGKCLCVKAGKTAKVRQQPCKDTDQTVSAASDTIHCFRYAGIDKSCTDGVRSILHAVDYFGETRYIGKAYLDVMPTDHQCCNEKYLKEVCKGYKPKKLTHEVATTFLESYGISQSSSNSCITRKQGIRGCTSLMDVNCRSIIGILWLRITSWKEIVITGGTEFGHTNGIYSHWNGYKIDIRSNVPGNSSELMDITRYIPKYFEYVKRRWNVKKKKGDKALIYRDSNGFEYSYEWRKYPKDMHWDIKYTDQSCVRESYTQPGLTGKTMCVVTTRLNVRDEDCSKMKIRGLDQNRMVKSGECYVSGGDNIICILAGTAYNMHKLVLDVDFGLELYGWVASDSQYSSKFIELEPEITHKKRRSVVYDVTCGHTKLSPNKEMSFLDDLNQRAKQGELPWHATILLDTDNICSGSIVDDQWILTTAHCLVNGNGFIVDRNRLTVEVGGIKLNDVENTTQMHAVEDIIVHDDFKLLTRENDVALVKTKNLITYNNYIQPICMFNSLDPLNETCYTTDMTAEGVLLIKKTRLVQCQKYSEWPGAMDRLIMCAKCGMDSVTSCQVYSGAMLVCKSKSKNSLWNLAGVTSWGTRGTSAAYPVYTNVSLYVDWVYDAMGVAG